MSSLGCTDLKQVTSAWKRMQTILASGNPDLTDSKDLRHNPAKVKSRPIRKKSGRSVVRYREPNNCPESLENSRSEAIFLVVLASTMFAWRLVRAAGLLLRGFDVGLGLRDWSSGGLCFAFLEIVVVVVS